jgi:SHAQKYF class myb-like DNA-binding protein
MTHLSSIANSSERLLKLDEFVKSLEDEMRKIDVFKRELPLATLLINDVIITLREESVHIRKSNIEPILEEFIPLNKSSDIFEKHDDAEKEMDARDKRNWLSSVQLWNGHDSPKSNSPIETNKVAEKEDHPVTVDKNGFTPFKGYSSFSVVVAGKEDNQVVPAEGLSLVTPGIKNLEEELNFGVLSYKTSCSKAISSSSMEERSNLRNGSQASQTSRKQRRCWSPELHRRFVNALQQLGGSQVATPKQIRELMQVDGLTNDEVKSHLQVCLQNVIYFLISNLTLM